jgi:hypothetical protein
VPLPSRARGTALSADVMPSPIDTHRVAIWSQGLSFALAHAKGRLTPESASANKDSGLPHVVFMQVRTADVFPPPGGGAPAALDLNLLRSPVRPWLVSSKPVPTLRRNTITVQLPPRPTSSSNGSSRGFRDSQSMRVHTSTNCSNINTRSIALE